MTSSAMVMKLFGHTRRVGECIEWTGPTNGVGYGVVAVRGERAYTHRVAYEEANGVTIPPGLVVDHLCRNTLCLRPEHLEAVTHRENMLRGSKAVQTECIHGHPFDESNTYVTAAGARSCRTCRKNRERGRRQRMRGAN